MKLADIKNPDAYSLDRLSAEQIINNAKPFDKSLF